MEDDDESTDSEFELDLDVEDGISVQVQDELSKYLSKNKTMVKKLDSKVRDFLGNNCVLKWFFFEKYEISMLF